MRRVKIFGLKIPKHKLQKRTYYTTLALFSVKMLRLKAKNEKKFKNDQLHVISRIFWTIRPSQPRRYFRERQGRE